MGITLSEWLSKSKCVISSSVEVKDTVYGGRGLFACERIGARTPIIKIEHSFLLNFTTIMAHICSQKETVPQDYKHIKVPITVSDSITDFYKEVKVEELLLLSSFQLTAMYLCLERQRESWWAPFLDVLPKISDFKTSPFIWLASPTDATNELLETLPQSTLKHAKTMRRKFNHDLEVVTSLLSKYSISNKLDYDEFLLAWVSVNSRCLYMLLPHPGTTDSNFTMAPFVDFINHSPNDQCTLKIDRTGFHVLTGDGYAEGDELFLSYGAHGNEFLLCEYGFTLPKNNWNDVDITNEILALLTKEQIEFLKEKEYLGDYTLTKDDISFRTEIALAVAQEGDLYLNGRLQAFMEGITEGGYYGLMSDRLLKRILLKLRREEEKFLNWCDAEDTNKAAVGKLYKDRATIIDARIETIDH